jgi:hypothetical protein
MGDPDLGGHGRGQRAVGPGGRPDLAGGTRAPGPPRQRQRPAQPIPAPGRCPGRAGPPHPGRRTPAPHRWVRPQLLVTVDLDSLLGLDGLGGEIGGAGPLDPETCRRLACDGAVTRVLVTRHPIHDPGGDARLAGQLRTALALLPPVLGGAPTQPLEVGRTSRVVTPVQRAALAVRGGGCGFPGCDRPLAWCEAHHLRHWLHGGPTDLANLALLCRAHHRAVHEGGWRLARSPDGRLAATPPHRKHRAAA